MKAVTFYHDNMPPEIVQAQKSVFDHFGIPIEQVKTELTHGEAIDHWLQTNEWDEVAIFDIDCIPLNAGVLMHAWHRLYQEKGLNFYGGAQRANHIEGSEVYVAPAFCCFSKPVWKLSGTPSFKDIPGFDVGAYFSKEASTVANMLTLRPSHVEVEKWDLYPPEVRFGLGTTWGNEVYHAFESRFNKNSQSRFIKKCKEVINVL